MSDESKKIIGLAKECSCGKSNVKIATVGQKAVVVCIHCGKRTAPCEVESNAIFLWNNGHTY